MDRPVWLLDVDGVINAPRAGWSRAPRAATMHVNGHALRLRWEPKLIGCIRLLHMAAIVEVRWATSWCPWTDRLEELWRLPALAEAWDGDPLDVPAAKLAAARAVLAEGRRLVWTDDDLDPADLPSTNGRALLIRPRPSRASARGHARNRDVRAPIGLKGRCPCS